MASFGGFLKGAGGVLSVLNPVVGGIAGVAGSLLQNRANAREAQKQRDFQADQAATGAQRAVKDFEAAGLNPALAYGHQAPAMAGAMADQVDPLASGVSNAVSAAKLRQDMRIQQEQNVESLRLMRAQAEKAQAEGQTSKELGAVYNWQARDWQNEFAQNQLRRAQEVALFPSQLRLAAANALLTGRQAELVGFQLPGAKANARYDEMMGIARPILGDVFTGARSVAPLLSPAGRAFQSVFGRGGATIPERPRIQGFDAVPSAKTAPKRPEVKGFSGGSKR